MYGVPHCNPNLVIYPMCQLPQLRATNITSSLTSTFRNSELKTDQRIKFVLNVVSISRLEESLTLKK